MIWLIVFASILAYVVIGQFVMIYAIYVLGPTYNGKTPTKSDSRLIFATSLAWPLLIPYAGVTQIAEHIQTSTRKGPIVAAGEIVDRVAMKLRDRKGVDT